MKNHSETLAFAGEQVISFLDEITRIPCPRCGEQSLSPTLVGTNLVVRCSESLQDYNNCEPLNGEVPLIDKVCNFLQVIKKTSIAHEPFNLQFKEGRATAKNVAGAKPRRGRPRKTT